MRVLLVLCVLMLSGCYQCHTNYRYEQGDKTYTGRIIWSGYGADTILVDDGSTVTISGTYRKIKLDSDCR